MTLKLNLEDMEPVTGGHPRQRKQPEDPNGGKAPVVLENPK